MKYLRVTILIILAIFISEAVNAQHRGRYRGKRVVVVKRSRYRPKRLVAFRPAWHPRWTCQRRWVYFPKQNFYWDNWRNHYVFNSGTVWISQTNPPSSATNVNLAEEKFYELDESDDDNDDIAMANARHQEKYKGN
jgi:hypothetical protein